MDIHNWARGRHEFWWKYLLQNMRCAHGMKVDTPTIEFSFKKSGYAGTAGYEGCTYNTNYLIEAKENFDSTIAHEICHVFVARLQWHSRNIQRVKGGHGPLWFYTFNVVCGFDKQKYHSYGAPKLTEEAKLLKKYKKLQELLTKSATNEGC